MAIKKIISYLGVLIFWSSLSWAHGENSPGPHNGFIRMPGAFHTEVVPAGDSSFKIYLLDMAWKNPEILNSEVVLIHRAEKDSLAECRTDTDHFICKFATSLDLKNGELIVKAHRGKQKGRAVSYPLPLKFTNTPDEHAEHH